MMEFLRFSLRKYFIDSSYFKLNLFIVITSSLAFMIMNDVSKELEVSFSFLLILVLATSSAMIEEIFYKDYLRGSLDFNFICFELDTIIIIKFLAVFLVSVISFIISFLIILVSLDLDFFSNIKLIFAAMPSLFSGSALLILLGSICVYFENKSSMISALILPFNLPSLILFGIYLKTDSIEYIYISFGLSLIILPIIYFLSSRLLKELYNN